LHGFYFLNKPVGITSSDLVLKIKKARNLKKIGHTGTLDRAAEGLMILPFGDYTCFSEHFLHGEKEYKAFISFGKSTDSGDKDGETVLEWNQEKTEEFYNNYKINIEEEIKKIPEQKEQIPPKISALKINGKRQSDLFREGKEIVTRPRQVSISELKYSNLAHEGFEFSVRVSSGTYIRKIVIDLSEKLKFPMHLTKLIRTKVKKIKLEEASSLEEICETGLPFRTMEEVLDLPVYFASEEASVKILHGQYPQIGEIENNEFIIKNKSGKILAWAKTTEKGIRLPYRYLKVFV
jgi:tRNA pseudouridine55 synthase